MENGSIGIPGVFSVGDVLRPPLDRGSREKTPLGVPDDDLKGGTKGDYRVRTPTRSERLNRALKELGPSAFKIHQLLWTWRGAPAKGLLSFFTIHSLAKFCSLTRPTVRSGLTELRRKGWIQKLPYNVHHKNALYRLEAIRKVPRPVGDDVPG